MPLDKLNSTILNELAQIEEEGRSKSPERIITGVVSGTDGAAPRLKLEGSDQSFLRMNSNGYLGLANDERLKKAAHDATEKYGVGPTAVRFIDGTAVPHVELEKRLAAFHKMEAAKIFSSAYMANLGLALAITNKTTYYISDALNHNSIIRALRIAGVSRENKAIYKHNDMPELRKRLEEVPAGMTRVIVIFDGVFSMRGDNAPMREIVDLAKEFNDKFEDGVITVVDDSHGTGAYGATGRGTPEISDGMDVDIITSTMGKAFCSNGGYVAASKGVIEMVRQRADTYIYTNPIAVADAAATLTSLDILDSEEGLGLLKTLRENAKYFREKIEGLGYETIPGQHPIIPVLIRDTTKAKAMVKGLYDRGILVVGLTFPVVPKGDETLRIQMCANHATADLDYVVKAFEELGKEQGVI